MDDMNREHSDVLRRMHTFEPPPEEFDPNTAPEKLLRTHGFPRRPDPIREPELARLWHRAFRRPTRMVKAELEIDPIMSHRNPLHDDQTRFQPGGWGGAVVQTSSLRYSPAEPANTVYGEFVAPPLIPAAGEELLTPLTVGFWVGLDGWNNNQVLQAGIAGTLTDVILFSSVTYYAWTEWYTDKYKDPAVKISNFEVLTGDPISVLVCAPRPDHGFVSMENRRTQQAVSVGIDARPGITSAGASAEWIVEGVSADLPDFLPISFDYASAGTQNHSFNLWPDGFTTNIMGAGGKALTTAIIVLPNAAAVFWQGSA